VSLFNKSGDGETGTPEATPPAASPPAGDPPAGDPPAGDPPASGGQSENERPDWLPENLWGEAGFNKEAFDALAARPEPQADVPADADAYVLPTIEGFDAEAAKDSPLFKSLRTNALANGLGQAAFEKVVADYVSEEVARAAETEREEKVKLGPNADARLATVETWVKGSLPAAPAKALLDVATTADSVLALEALMNARASAAPRDPPPPPAPPKTREQLREMMKDVRYRGSAQQRDPAYIKEIDAAYAAIASQGRK
jgi:hypothetical protein